MITARIYTLNHKFKTCIKFIIQFCSINFLQNTMYFIKKKIIFEIQELIKINYELNFIPTGL